MPCYFNLIIFRLLSCFRAIANVVTAQVQPNSWDQPTGRHRWTLPFLAHSLRRRSSRGEMSGCGSGSWEIAWRKKPAQLTDRLHAPGILAPRPIILTSMPLSSLRSSLRPRGGWARGCAGHADRPCGPSSPRLQMGKPPSEAHCDKRDS